MANPKLPSYHINFLFVPYFLIVLNHTTESCSFQGLGMHWA